MTVTNEKEASSIPLSLLGYKSGLLRAAYILLEGRLDGSTLAEITAKVLKELKEAEDAR